MSRRCRISGLGFAALAALALSSCGDNGGQSSNRGDLLISYFQGGPEPGAILLTITGGQVEDVTALGGQQVSFAAPFSGTTRVVITGNLSNGDLLRIRVPDVTLFTNYRARADQAADKVTFVLLEPTAYQLTVHR